MRYPSKMKIIRRRNQGVDAVGGPSFVEDVVHTSVRCRIRVLSGIERQGLGQEGLFGSHRIYCDKRTDVLQSDIIEIDGVRYDPVLIDHPHKISRYLEIDVEERPDNASSRQD